MKIRKGQKLVLIGVNDVWRQFDLPRMPETHVPLDEYEHTQTLGYKW
jgi:hypothetical protein